MKRTNRLPPLLLLLVGGLAGCDRTSPGGQAPVFEVRDSTTYENNLEESSRGVLYRNGVAVDTIDLATGVQPLGDSLVLVRRVRTHTSDDPLTSGPFATDHVLVGPKGVEELHTKLPGYHPDFSWPRVVAGKILYWGLEETEEFDFRLLAVRYDPATEQTEQTFLFRDPIETDDPYFLEPVRVEGEQLVFGSRGRCWRLDAALRLVEPVPPANESVGWHSGIPCPSASMPAPPAP